MTNDNLTSRQIQEAIGFLSKPFYSAATNVESIAKDSDTGVLVFQLDISNSELIEARKERDDLQKEVDEYEIDYRKLEVEKEDLESLLDDYKDGDKTPQSMRAELDQARDNSQKWKYALDEKDKELKILRQRKGMWVNFIKNSKDIVSFIKECSENNFDSAKAKELLTLITQKE